MKAIREAIKEVGKLLSLGEKVRDLGATIEAVCEHLSVELLPQIEADAILACDVAREEEQGRRGNMRQPRVNACSDCSG